MISGKVTTKKQLNAIISDASELDGVVSVGGTVVGASLSQRGVTGAKGQDGHSPVVTASKVDDTTTVYVDGSAIATIDDGIDGQDGQDGHSPSITASKAGKVTTVYVDGSSVATINDGNDGQDGQDGSDGQDGHSPVVTASKVGKVTTVSVDGSAIATINDGNDGQTGSDGQDGADGYSPSASVSKSGSIATITITDKNGTTTASVSDGSGVPTGGTSGQVLTKHSATDYDVLWADASGGTITDVTVDGTSIVNDGVAELETATQLRDGLMTATDKQKLDGIASGAEANVNADWSAVSGDALILNKPTIPTDLSDLNNDMNVSDFPNDAGYITGYTETDPTVPSWAKQASKPSYTAAEVGAVPTTRKVNGKALSADISLTATDVSALPASTSIPSKTSDLTNDSGFISDTGIFLALVNTATYVEVSAAIAAGKIVFAYTSNSYGSYNFYEYAFAGQDVFYFCRMHGQANSPSYKVWALDDTDTWTNSTSTPWYDGLCDLDTTAASGTTDGDLYAAIVALGWENDVIE